MNLLPKLTTVACAAAMFLATTPAWSQAVEPLDMRAPESSHATLYDGYPDDSDFAGPWCYRCGYFAGPRLHAFSHFAGHAVHGHR